MIGRSGAEVVALVEFQRHLTYLRADEGDSVTLFCDNPDPAAPDQNNAIECCGSWTGWMDCRFHGETLDAAIRMAVEAKRVAEVLATGPTVLAPKSKPSENPAEVIGYCWEALEPVAYRGIHHYGPPPARNSKGMVQVWIMRNGQEVRATWKERA